MERDIGKIKKNDTSDIILRVDNFADKKGLTIREFVTSDRYTGFTKAGVKIMAADFPKFKEMINSVTEEDMKAEAITPKEPEQETLNTAAPKGVPSVNGDINTEGKKNISDEGLPDY